MATPHQVNYRTPVQEMVASATCWPEPRGVKGPFLLPSPPICGPNCHRNNVVRPQVCVRAKHCVHRKRFVRECAVYAQSGYISACTLMSARLRTFSLTLPHGGDRRRARSEPRGSVRGAGAVAAVAARCLRSNLSVRTRLPHATCPQSHLCIAMRHGPREGCR